MRRWPWAIPFIIFLPKRTRLYEILIWRKQNS
jgi:hypothetical protein